MPPVRHRPLGATPVLVVRDVGAAVERYRQLGFAAESDGRPTPAYGYASWGEAPVLLVARSGVDPAVNTAGVFLTVTNAASLHEAWRTSGAGGQISSLRSTDAGTIEFYYRDADGNLLRVASAAPNTPDVRPMTPPAET